MFKCKYCGKEFETKQQLGGHVTRCKLNPNYQNNLQQLENARKHINKKKSTFTLSILWKRNRK